jgi:prepilin-type N-terminal cleavage/methylation domain-containing protein
MVRGLYSRGFTLVESMVAISILSLAITGPLLIAQKGVASAIYARDQITAFYLAQEAVEYIRNVRDSNRISGANWLQSLAVCTGGATCFIDARYSDFTSPQAVQVCPSNICPKINYDTASKLYTYSVGTPTAFTRTIRIDNSVSNEALVEVTIAWQTALFAPVRTFAVREYIFNF